MTPGAVSSTPIRVSATMSGGRWSARARTSSFSIPFCSERTVVSGRTTGRSASAAAGVSYDLTHTRTSSGGDPRHLLRLGWHLEVGLRLEAEAAGIERGREALHVRVVGTDGLVVAHALDRDPVLRARELVGQPGELCVGLQVGIALSDREQPA